MEHTDWMLGMAQNIVNIVQQNAKLPMMPEILSLAHAIEAYLHHLNYQRVLNPTWAEMLEEQLRTTEEMLKRMDLNDEERKRQLRERLELHALVFSSLCFKTH